MRTIFLPEWIVDGLGAPPLPDHAVVVADGLIETVAPVVRVEGRDGDQRIDLPGATLLPGLINNHVHLVLPGDNTPFVPWIDGQSDAALALRAAHNAQISLRAGVATVRECGGRGTTVLDLRAAQGNGLAGGARVVACGWPLTITRGHTRQFGGEVDGEDGLRRMVRRAVGEGADYVKVMAAGGGTPGSLSQYPSFSLAELRAIVETAHGLGRRVAMHCIATASIDLAVRAGADLIEHASFFGPDLVPRYDPAVAERLARAAIPVTPTLQVARDLVGVLPEGPERSLWRRRGEEHRAIVARLRGLGVPILAGSDAGWRATAFDTFWKEMEELVACGLAPDEAVGAATGAAGAALGYGDRFGTIAPGRIADLLAVDGDLAADVGCLRHVRGVFRGGCAVASLPEDGGGWSRLRPRSYSLERRGWRVGGAAGCWVRPGGVTTIGSVASIRGRRRGEAVAVSEVGDPLPGGVVGDGTAGRPEWVASPAGWRDERGGRAAAAAGGVRWTVPADGWSGGWRS